MDGVLLKPVCPEELAEILVAFLPCGPGASCPGDAGSGGGGAFPVVDRECLVRRLLGDAGAAERILDDFSVHVGEVLEELGTLNPRREADRDRLRLLAHQLRGAAAQISARRLERAASRLEAQLEKGLPGENGLLGLKKAARDVQMDLSPKNPRTRHEDSDRG